VKSMDGLTEEAVLRVSTLMNDDRLDGAPPPFPFILGTLLNWVSSVNDSRNN
jgi:hypothetical protein